MPRIIQDILVGEASFSRQEVCERILITAYPSRLFIFITES